MGLGSAGDRSPEGIAFYRAWEAWGTWGNGGVEQLLTGGLADEATEVLSALVAVGAGPVAEVFRRAFALVSGDIEERNDQWEASPEIERRATALDRELAQLPDVAEGALARFLADHPELWARAGLSPRG